MPTHSLPSRPNSRRNFLRAGVTAGLATVVHPALGSARVVDRPPAPVDAQSRSLAGDFELDEITIDGLQKAFESGQYSSRSVTEKYLSRIHDIDKTGPMLNAVIELNPDALQIAEALDKERQIQRSARATSRHSGPHQGQHRHRGPDEYNGRIARPAGIASSE